MEEYKKPGLDCLKEKLKEMGIKPQALNSPIIPAMLCIFSQYFENGTAGMVSWKVYRDLIAEVEKKRSDALQREADASNSADEYYRKIIDLKTREFRICARETEIKEREQKLQETKDKIYQAETPEARDRLRMADYFREYTEVTNGYERTAYINGLADILSGKKAEDEI